MAPRCTAASTCGAAASAAGSTPTAGRIRTSSPRTWSAAASPSRSPRRSRRAWCWRTASSKSATRPRACSAGTIAQSARFDGRGVGAELGWYGREWSGYLRGIGYDYDAQLDRAIAASRAPATRAFPRVASLVNAVLTRTAGAIDYQASLGIDRAFARSGIGLDLTLSSDAISGDDSTSLSAAWRYDLTTRVGVDVTLGLTETDGLDSTGLRRPWVLVPQLR
jgi:hypothetical protein